MAVYSGESILSSSNKRRVTARFLKAHLKDTSREHGTDRCSYCNLAAWDFGLVPDPIVEDDE